MGCGTIRVFDNRNNLLEVRHFYTLEGMRNIAKKWMEEYAGDGNYIQVYPKPYLKREHETCKSLIQKEVIPDKPKENKRPPSVYTNLPIGFKYSNNDTKLSKPKPLQIK